MKIPSHSLYAKLVRANQLDEFFVWYYREHPGYKEITSWLEERGLPHSAGAIHTLLRVHSLHWKVEQSERRAAATAASLPKNTAEMIRQQLELKEFDLSMADLTVQEQISLLNYNVTRNALQGKAELEKEKLALKRESEARMQEHLALARQKFQRETCKLFLTWYEDQRATGVAGATGIATGEKIERLGKLMFGEEW